MSNSQTSFRDTIAKLYYKKIGFTEQYLDKYGGSVVFTSLVVLVLIGILSYHYFLNNMAYYKKEWINHRCNPFLMPFAGIIHSFPHGSLSEILNYTAENYNKCLNNDLKQVVGSSNNPSYYAHHQMSANSNITHKTINQARKIFNTIRNDIQNMTKRIFNRMSNMLVPVTQMFVKTKDIFGKTAGILTTGLMLLLAVYDTSKAMLGAFVELLIISIIILVAMIVIMWIFPWDWPIAIVMPAIFIFLGTMAAIIAYWTNKIYKLTLDKVPTTTCFAGDTEISLQGGTKLLRDVIPGDILYDGTTITSVMKLASDHKNLFSHHGVIVSGSHKILVNNKYIDIEDHPDSIPISNNESHLYCLSTTTGTININGIVFADWDEIGEEDWQNIKRKTQRYLPEDSKRKDMHKYLNAGFTKDTSIELLDGTSVSINAICVNDILKNGERVLGIVRIDGREMHGLKEFGIAGRRFRGGANLCFIDKNLGNMTSLDMPRTSTFVADELYHLITDTKFFTIENIKFYDYNSAVELLLEGPYLLFDNV